LGILGVLSRRLSDQLVYEVGLSVYSYDAMIARLL
jgi:hypothetical protein